MKKDIEGYVKWLNGKKAARKKALSVLLAMSVVVSGNVFWFLKAEGTALAGELACGREEHTHSDECYESRLICVNGEEGHEHDDSCYEQVLICGMEEHVHGADCYEQISTDHETTNDWEDTIPDLTGDRAADLAAVALSQVGYEEGSDGYSRYGSWYGNPNGDWNVMFVSFCMHYAEITDIPSGSGCWAWQVGLSDEGLLTTDGRNIRSGDIVLMDRDGDGKCDQAGIAVSVEDDEMTLVIGDVDGKVITCDCLLSDSVICGYVQVAPAETEPEITGSDNEDNKVFSATTGSGITVNAAAPADAFPAGVVMSASDIIDNDVIAQAEEATEQSIGESEEIKGTIAVDITFTDSEGNEVEPAEGTTVDVSMTIPESRQLEGSDYRLFHISDDVVESVDNAVVSAEAASFTAEGFSIYVMTATGEKDKDRINAYLDAAGMDESLNVDGYIPNSRYHPYYLRVGETVEVIGRVSDGSTPDIELWADFFGSVISIEDEVAVPGEVRATIRALTPGEAAIKLAGVEPEESFSMNVLDGRNIANVRFDFDTIPVYNGDPESIPTFNVHALDTVTVIGTRRNGSDNFPYKDESDNPNGWVITTDPNQGGFVDEGNNKYGRRLIIDRYDDNCEQIISYYTAQGLKKVRIKVREDMIDHADIEIADGGVYTNVSFDLGDHGLVKTVTRYQSYVHGVNSCKLYDANGNLIPMYNRSNHTYVPVDATNGHFKHDDYWHDSRFSPGMSQYELTSKYRKDYDEGPYIWGTKRFMYDDVDHAVFDVELQIIPMEIETYEWNGTQWSPSPVSRETYTIDYQHGSYVKHVAGEPDVSGDLSDITNVEDSTVFELDRRHVIDAYNKCPNHTGLDFTVHANHASVKFGANKELTNGKMQGDDFTFELVDTSMTPPEVIQVKNSADGKILFGNIEYDSVGVHTYEIREVPGTDTNIIYDPTVYSVTVTVTEEVDQDTGTRYLMANVTEGTGNYNFKFVNKVIFKLPDTGGGGIVPFLAVGSAMIGTSLILLMLRRRKEVDL
ncbi:MAG: LPXTG cell wall anchor domain-containing protein [Clostridiales bacterium]|nr:LPXTG cell wall anchor domain-containing protein [Clostridiales bacterium]